MNMTKSDVEEKNKLMAVNMIRELNAVLIKIGYYIDEMSFEFNN